MINAAKKLDLLLSEFVNRAVKQSIELDHLTESQEQFANTFEVIFKRIYEPYFKKQVAISNRINFNQRWTIRVLNLLLKHIKIPQDKDEILTSFVDHPILDIANNEVIKEIRSNKQKSEVIEDEFE